MSINKRQADLMLFIVAILWGSSYVFAKLTVEAGMHSGLINACRGDHVCTSRRPNFLQEDPAHDLG